MRTLIVSVVLAVAFALIGPRLTGPQNQAAGAPFVYEPPPGFALADGRAGTEGAMVWIDSASAKTPGGSNSVRVILNHSSKVMSVDEGDLAQLVVDMPTAFEHCTWSHVRHELRTRTDGARVGLIEGDCKHDVMLGSFGLPDKTIHERKLQLLFPDDSGTSIVTASYPTEQVAQWEPLFEATIGKARGVATRVPPPAPWTYAAWALAGAVLGWFGGALGRRSERSAKDAPKDAPK